MERMKVSQVAKKLGVSNQAIYQRLSKVDSELTAHVTKEGRATFIDVGGIALLAKAFSVAKPEPVSSVDQHVDSFMETLKKELEQKQKVIDAQQATIDTMVREHAEAQRRNDTIVMKLTNDVGNLSKQLEYREKEKAVAEEVLKKPIQPVQPWIPPKRQNPLEGKSWVEKAFIYFFHPEQLRCSEG